MAHRPDPSRRRGGFFWQGLLILLPVLVLAAIGLVSIQQDKALVQREAAEHAQTLAQDLIETFWPALVDEAGLTNESSFEVDWTGQLLSPPPAPPLPTPQPFNLDELTQEQADQWAAAQAAAMDSGSPTNALLAWRQFAQTKPPPRWAATAQYRIALLLAATGDAWSARGLFADTVTNFPDATSEAGLFLAPLARLKSIELAPKGSGPPLADLAALCESAVRRPTPLTPFLLDHVAELEVAYGDIAVSKTWRKTWAEQEFVRQLHAAARPVLTNSPALPRLRWFTVGTFQPASGFLYLATRLATNATSARYVCRPLLHEYNLLLVENMQHPRTVLFDTRVIRTVERDAPGTPTVLTPPPDFPRWADSFLAALSKAQARMPQYFRLTVEIAGQALINTNDLPSAVSPNDILSSGQIWNATMSKPLPGAKQPPLLAVARKFDEGMEALRVGVHLVNPETLFERQRSRSRLFGLLIGASAVAAVAGFLAARRAFLRSQQLSDLKSNFVSSVSHELRAPLASVRLMAENLERGKIADAAKQNEYFRFIVQECRRLGALVENVLDFARIEQGRKEYDFEPTDVAALLQQTVKLLEPTAAEKGVAIVIPPNGSEISDLKSQISVDAAAIQQALINLLDNAIKHSPARSTVTVGLTPPTSHSTNGCASRFTLYVQDNGPGIPLEEHEKIFQRFYRRGPELRRETQGVGIGLSIVKHIAEAHGGRVVVESEVGKGSRFAIELPLHQNKPPE